MPSWEDPAKIEALINETIDASGLFARKQPSPEDLSHSADNLMGALRRSSFVDQTVYAYVNIEAWEVQALREAWAAAANDLQANGPQLAQQIPQAAEAAKEIPEDSPVAQAAHAIADAMRQIDTSKLGPLGVLILLFWLIFYHMNVPQIAGATLFYMVLSDYLKKQD